MPPYPFETIGADLYGPLTGRSERKSGQYILTIVDRLTEYTRFLVMQNGTARSGFDVILTLLLLEERVRYIISDNGPYTKE